MKHGRNADLRLAVVFNNVALRPRLTTGWGFSCLVERGTETVLFDTGADGSVLLRNMRAMDLDPARIDAVVLSHLHADHTGGLPAVLSRRPDIDVWFPVEPPLDMRRSVVEHGSRAIPAAEGGMLFREGIGTTGPLGQGIAEQALLVDAGEGIVVITGCAHPGIHRIAAAAVQMADRPITLLMGGFHLGGLPRSRQRAIVNRLRALGVRSVAPSHCTGEAATQMFRETWGHDFVEGGLGAVIEIALR